MTAVAGIPTQTLLGFSAFNTSGFWSLAQLVSPGLGGLGGLGGLSVELTAFGFYDVGAAYAPHRTSQRRAPWSPPILSQLARGWSSHPALCDLKKTAPRRSSHWPQL